LQLLLRMDVSRFGLRLHSVWVGTDNHTNRDWVVMHRLWALRFVLFSSLLARWIRHSRIRCTELSAVVFFSHTSAFHRPAAIRQETMEDVIWLLWTRLMAAFVLPCSRRQQTVRGEVHRLLRTHMRQRHDGHDTLTRVSKMEC